MEFQSEIEREDFLAAAILIEGVEVHPSGPALLKQLESLYEELAEGRAGGGEERRKAVRDVLRNGKYKPAGRGKPASEYLSGIWKESGCLDLINNVVDVNNLVSLRHGLPISAFDVSKMSGGVTIRLGRSGEQYVFNASGQELDCADLIVVCDETGPIGSPIKDSQATKLFPGATEILYVVYANRFHTPPDDLLAVAAELGSALAEDCPGAGVSEAVIFQRG